MKESDIQLLIEEFLRPTYGIDEAIAFFGDIKDESTPNMIYLTPKNRSFTEIHLEYLELDDAPPGERYLSGVAIEMEKQPLVSFVPFEERYGTPAQGPFIHPSHPVPYRFHIEGDPNSVDLLLYVFEDSLPGTEIVERRMEMLKLLRYPS